MMNYFMITFWEKKDSLHKTEWTKRQTCGDAAMFFQASDQTNPICTLLRAEQERSLGAQELKIFLDKKVRKAI